MQHVRLRHQISAQKRKETIQEKELKKAVKTNEERGAMNVSTTERNLMKAKAECCMEDLKTSRSRKNELLDAIVELLHRTVKAKMTKGQLEKLDKAEEKVEAERAACNTRYEDLDL